MESRQKMPRCQFGCHNRDQRGELSRPVDKPAGSSGLKNGLAIDLPQVIP